MDIKDIEHLAELSKLKFTDEELKDFLKDFESIVALADTIKNTDIDGEIKIETIDYNELREDVSQDSYPVEILTQNAPMAKKDCFVVPRIME